MTVNIDASGRRSVQVDVEVPGTPEEVWQAIATGPGVSSWFVPTEMEEGEGGVPGKLVSHFGPGMDAVATPTAWDPPRRFSAESRDDLGPNGPPVATEWIVEARSGGTCVVRVVHSLFASDEAWDEQMQGWEHGWPQFFRILRLYLTHFRGQRCSAVSVVGPVPGPEPEAWGAVTRSLGLAGATVGERRSAPDGTPPLAGTVEPSGEGKEILLRLDEPAPGIAHLFTHSMGGGVIAAVRLYLYGDRAPAAVARDEPLWQAWMKKRSGSAGDASKTG